MSQLQTGIPAGSSDPIHSRYAVLSDLRLRHFRPDIINIPPCYDTVHHDRIRRSVLHAVQALLEGPTTVLASDSNRGEILALDTPSQRHLNGLSPLNFPLESAGQQRFAGFIRT